MQTVLITGGTGMIGSALAEMLVRDGYNVIILSRKAAGRKPAPVSPGQETGTIKFAIWDIKAGTIDVAAVQEAHHIIHLAGAGVMDKKWSPAFKKEIVESRTKSSELIIDTLKNNHNKVTSVISASATGWYRQGNEQTGHTEDEPADKSFLGETCRLWEEGIEPVTALGKRLVRLRTGIVLSNGGGALAEFKKPLRFGVAAILGNGKQVVSWIHIDDVCRMFIHALNNESMRGSYNAVAPAPVSNKQLTLTLAKITNRNFYIPMYVPSFILKLVMGGRSIEILKSNNVSCAKIQQAGYNFLYPTVNAALEDLCKKKS